jgi:hypothetical protein
MEYEPTKADWDALWNHAGMLKNMAGSGNVPNGVRGRWISTLVDRVCAFWEQHKDTLIPWLSQFAIAALEALLSARTNIDSVNGRGPR